MPTFKKKRIMSEHAHQCALIEWCQVMGHRHKELNSIFAIPNSGTRSTAMMGLFHKKEGLKKGVPDLFLPVARHGKHGLFVEMKSEKGKLSIDQEHWICGLDKNGYAVAVCFNSDQAIKTLCKYLNIREN